MKTQKHLIALTLFACSTLSAQQLPSTTSAPSSTPTTTKEYSSSEGRFKVSFPFPCTPNEINGPVDSKLGKVAFHMLLCVSATVTYSVTYTDYPSDLESPELVQKALDTAREGSLSRLAKEDPRIIKEFDISIDGHPGRFLQIELKGDGMVRSKYFIAANRLYVFGAGTPKKKPLVVDATNDYETIANRFMDSFKLIPPLEADVSETWKEFSSAEGKFKVQFPGTPVESSLAAGSSGFMHVAAYKSAALYSAMYLDYFEPLKNFVAVMELLDNLRLGEFETAEKGGLNPKLLSETSLSFEGYPGRLLVLEFSNNQIYRRKMIVVKNRVYILTATAPKDDPKVGNNSYEALSLRFINSFRLLAQPTKD
ncbi:MAG TPA: hypothetical protein VLB46_16915 [Pyrinomonadaceae bacterium]|nr:hypothetical protein [Pyrinomonadaceae bacterium]